LQQVTEGGLKAVRLDRSRVAWCGYQGIFVRIVLNIIGVILAFFGIVWILQGLNILANSEMSGHIKWTIIGAIVLLVAVPIFLSANRKKA
jgi:hypothetical protein